MDVTPDFQTIKAPLRVMIVNLDRDTARLAEAMEAFGEVGGFCPERSAGVLGSSLPFAAQHMLTGRRNPGAGALGCFLAHVRVWEEVVQGTEWVLVVEDDAAPVQAGRVFDIRIPADARLVFVNGRTDPGALHAGAAVPRVCPVTDFTIARARRPGSGASPGTDGYLLHPDGARRLLKAVVADGLAGHVDWRLLRYCLEASVMDGVLRGTRYEGSPGLRRGREDAAQWGVLRGYCLSPSLVDHCGEDSARRSEDQAGLARLAALQAARGRQRASPRRAG